MTAGSGFAAQAMILAAGRGERMRPLTDTCPKPLLAVHGKPLMQWPMEALARGGFTRLVVNTAWLDDKIEGHFGPQGSPVLPAALSKSEQKPPPWQIAWSREGRDFGGALETAGGILRALPLLDDVFWLVAGDVYMPGFGFGAGAVQRFAASGRLAHLFLVPNPPHNPGGDFGLAADGLAISRAAQQYTYSTCGLFRQAFFDGLPRGNPGGLQLKLAPLLRDAMARGQVSAELFTGEWVDVGTPQRLAALNASPPPHT